MEDLNELIKENNGSERVLNENLTDGIDENSDCNLDLEEEKNNYEVIDKSDSETVRNCEIISPNKSSSVEENIISSVSNDLEGAEMNLESEVKSKNSSDNKYTDNDSSNCCSDSTSEITKPSTKSSALSSLLAYGDSSSEEEKENDDNIDDKDIYHEYVSKLASTRLNQGNENNAFNSGSRVFGDMSLTFPRTQQIVDDDLLSLSSSSSSSFTSLVFSVNSDFSDDDELDANNENKAEKSKKKPTPNKKRTLLTKGELTLDDLPAIEDLQITVPEDQCVLLGKILNIVDKLVVVQALKDLPPLDLDTVLFLEWNKPLGHVFDVFGPVVEPLYCIRFNSTEHIQMKDISVGMSVYFVPKSNYTKFVFVKDLISVKGSDASWEDNNEPPLEFLDFSDDEQERQAKKQLRKINFRKDQHDTSEQPEKKRPTAYERRMNRRNLRMSEMQGGPNFKTEPKVNKQWRQHNQLIRPPTLMAPPSCDYQNNFSSAETTFHNAPVSNLRLTPLKKLTRQNISTSQRIQDCFPSFNHNEQGGVSFQSPGFPGFSAPVGQHSFQSPCNWNNNLIPNRPPPPLSSPFISTGNINMFNPSLPPQLHHTSNMFSSSASPVPHNNHTSMYFPLPPAPTNVFSSPPPNFLNNNSPLPCTSRTPPGPSFNHGQSASTFSSFPFFSGNETQSPNFHLSSTSANHNNNNNFGSLFSSPPPTIKQEKFNSTPRNSRF